MGAPRLQVFGVLLALALGVAGCQKPDRVVPEDLRPERRQTAAPMPAYGTLVDRFNGNIAGLDQMWGRTKVKLEFRDEDGDVRREDGEGVFMMRRPMDTALTVGKFGKTGLWAGSNDQRFWLFDKQEDVVYVGAHENVGKPCARPLPLGIRPQDVLLLLGLVPLDQSSAATAPPVEAMQGYALLEPPGRPVRYLLDPKTALPVRADLVGPDGHSQIVARLSEPRTVRVQGLAPEQWPRIMSKADLYVIGEEARLTLDLSDLSDARSGEGTIRDAAFDYDSLLRAHKPDVVVDLDAACR